MESRIRWALHVRELTQAQLVEAINQRAEDGKTGKTITRGTLNNLLQRGSGRSEWSEVIAQVLGVSHHWLQSNEGAMDASSDWPFKKISHWAIKRMRPDDLDALEVAIIGAAVALKLDVLNANSGRSEESAPKSTILQKSA